MKSGWLKRARNNAVNATNASNADNESLGA
jgi:hypothetical protein